MPFLPRANLPKKNRGGAAAGSPTQSYVANVPLAELGIFWSIPLHPHEKGMDSKKNVPKKTNSKAKMVFLFTGCFFLVQSFLILMG